MATVKNGNFITFFLLFFSNISSGFVGSFLFHLIASRIFKSASPFGATFRIVAYASIMDLISWVPIIGIAAYLYSLYLIFIGLQEIHNISQKNAGLTIFSVIIFILVMLLMVISIAPESVHESIKMMGMESRQR